MTISSISSTSQLTQVTSTPRTRGPRAAETAESGDRADLSPMGQMMGRLQDLAETDPAKAKEVLATIAEGLAAKAEETGDSKMSELAEKLASAAETGDLSALEPKRPSGPPPGDSKLQKYRDSGEDPMAQIEAIFANALAA